MINKMREMAPMIMLIILVAFVGGTIFLDWGMNLGNRSKVVIAGKINGRDVQIAYFDQLVNMERQRMQDGGKEVPPQQYRMVPQQVWEREVSKRLMEEIVRKLHLGASAEEIFYYIKKNPLPGIDTVSFFQTEGRFDTSKYVQFLNDPQSYQQYGWLHEVESYTANSIVPAQKLEKLLAGTAVPSPSELAFQYARKNSKVVYEYIKADNARFTPDSSEFTDAKIAQFYEAHRDSFKVEKQTDLYYVKFAKESTPADEQFYRQELVELKSRIEAAGKPLAEAFAEEAIIESDDQSTAPQGGNLDWFVQGAMVGPFDTVAFSLPVGTISEPVRTSFGFHLIFVEAREMRDSVLKVHARHILRKVVPTIETLDLLAEHADSLRTKMLDIGFLAAAKTEKKLTVDSTGLFEKGAPIPGIGFLSGSGNFAFGKSEASVSERLENTEGIYLLAIKRSVPKGQMQLDAAKDGIKQKLRETAMAAAAKKYLEKIRGTLDVGASIANYKATDTTVVSGVTDTVSGADYVPQVGYQSPVTALALALEVGKISGVIENSGSAYIVKTVWKQGVTSIPSVTSPEMQQISAQLQQQAAQKLYYEWYLDSKNRATIKCNVNDLYLD